MFPTKIKMRYIHQCLHHWPQSELLSRQQHCSRDDSSVVTKQESSDGRQEREQVESERNTGGAGSDWWTEQCVLIRLISVIYHLVNVVFSICLGLDCSPRFEQQVCCRYKLKSSLNNEVKSVLWFTISVFRRISTLSHTWVTIY